MHSNIEMGVFIGYSPEMLKTADILVWRDANPFVPFDLHLSDGRIVHVDNRDLLWVGRNKITLGIPSGPERLSRRAHRSIAHRRCSAERELIDRFMLATHG